MRRAILLFLTTCTLLSLASPAYAQFAGNNTRGDYGLMSGSQPGPGFYFIPAYLGYDGDTIRNRAGDVVAIDPDRRGDLKANGFVIGAWYVSERKILGANYGFVVFANLTNNALSVPVLGLSSRSSLGLGDLYVQPLNLGWHTDRADYTAGIGVYAPTGRYDPAADDNLGLGMWGFELFAGATVYLDKARSWNLATTAFFETHTTKEGSNIKVGDLLTLEGGLGKSFMDGAINVGVAYFAQWKLSRDSLGLDFDPASLGAIANLPPDWRIGKQRSFGFGPELSVPIATKKKLYAILNARFLWDTGARSTTQGKTLMILATFPVPSVTL